MLFGVKTTILDLGNSHPNIYADVAIEAERLGFESFWVGHHVIFESMISGEYPHTDDGVVPLNPAGDYYDPWVLLSHLGALTSRIRFGSAVFLLPMVNPFITARAVATADLLTKGRIILGIGVGWNQAEYANLGAEFASRGERTDEIIEILRRLWTQPSEIEFHGQHYSFGPVEFRPKPHQTPHPPIMYGGGESDRVLRRAANLDGFIFPPNVAIETISTTADRIRGLRQETERSAEPYELTAIVDKGLTLDYLCRLEDLGVSRVIIDAGRAPFDIDSSWLPRTSEALCSNLNRVAELLHPLMSG